MLFLYPFDLSTKQRTGAHPGKTFSAAADPVMFDPMHKWWSPDVEFTRFPERMHKLLVRRAREGRSIYVRARRAHQGGFLRRIKSPEGGCPAGLAELRTHVMPWDCDGWPNLWKLDPRTQGDALRAELLKLLGPEFVEASHSFQWSSSCCVGVPHWQVPEFVSFRVWSWAHREVGEAEGRELAKRLDARVRPILGNKDGYLVDPKVYDLQQPIYLANPAFKGMPDPFGYRRWAFVRCTQSVLDIDRLEKDLPSPTRKTAWTRPEGEPMAATARPVPKPRTATVIVPGQPIPFELAARELSAAREALEAKGVEAFRDRCNGFGIARGSLEMVGLAIHRGGLQPGERDECATMIASGVVASLPPDGRPPEQVRAKVRAVLRLCVSDEWISAEWEGKADISVVGNFARASVLAAAGKLTRRSEPRYTYGMDRLCMEWAPTEEEVRILGLKSIAPQWVVSKLTREAAGADKRIAKLTLRAENLRRVNELRATGASLRAIVSETGLPYTTVRHLLKDGAPAEERSGERRGGQEAVAGHAFPAQMDLAA
jgi:hypothetical protein